jgi:fumarate reductase flavoprotein subunit
MSTAAILDSLPGAADVVVIGAGLAGHCAALAAAQAGGQVALIEKADRPGGSTVMSAGSFALAGTDLQRRAGIEDSPAQLTQELMKISGGRADPRLVDAYVEDQLETYAWLKAQEVEFHDLSLSSGTSVPRTHPTHSPQLIAALHQQVLHTPSIRFAAGVAARRLLAGRDGRIGAVELQAAGATAVIQARCGVVIASGGFTRDPQRVESCSPGLSRAPAWGGIANTGDGLTMAEEHGASLADMEFVAATFGVVLNHYPDTSVRAEDELLLRMAMYRGGIAVNLQACRFADESQSYKKLATLCLRQPRAVAFQLFDQRIMDQSVPNPSVNDFAGVLRRGVLRQAPNWPALAQQVGLDGARLQATVDRYNAMVDRGHDEDFQRTTLGGGFGKPVRLDAPPFFALPCSAAMLSTYAGLRIDPQMRVLRTDGSPIPGLFAAGEVVGGFHGAGYMSGSALGKAAIFGRRAGHHATVRT